jgi:hypothetical protein
MAQENTQQKHDGYDQENNDPRLLNADIGLQGKVTDFEKGKKASNESSFREAAANEAQYQLERIALAEAQEATRRAVMRRQMMLKERHATSVASKVKGIGGFARWGGLAVAITAWFWQFVCAGISLVGIGLWATISEMVNGNFVGRAINWGLGLFGTSIESLIPTDTFALAFWALATLIALCTFVGFCIWFYLTGAHVFDTPLIALMTTHTYALSIMPVSNLFPWIPLWVVVINARSTLELASGMLRKTP